MMFYEIAASPCPDKDVSSDHHLKDINFSILFMRTEGRGGGDPSEDYTANLSISSGI
ncbi:hypothetical protein [Saccharicrinis sp. 156]|uniref:hypothetical protein n=1 Tax=Saccharicrinis sp. 156 TaxID=3417574 RepID=UPI003D34E738